MILLSGISKSNNTTGITIGINDGTGIDLTVNGSFADAGPNDINWLGSSSWTIGSSGSLIRSSATSSDKWRNQYSGGISTIPATSNWTLIKTGTANPLLTSTGGMYYPNLTIQNTTSSTWTTSGSSSFTGSTDFPRIKGNLYIGGSGGVSFVINNTNASPVLVQGSFTLATGSTLKNQGTGLEVQGNVNFNGVDSTTTGSVIKFSGSNLQTLSGSNLNFRNLRVYKTLSIATITLSSACTIRGYLQLDTGVIVSDTVNLLTFNAGSLTTGVNDSSFVSGPVKKIGNTDFIFPLGKHSNSQTIEISAPSNVTDAFQAEYFDTNPTTIYGVYTDTTFNYISTCQYFNLLRKNGTSNIQPTLSYDQTSCVSNLLPNPRVIGYNGTKWKDLGFSNLAVTYSPPGGTIATASVVTQYGAITLGNSNPLISNTPNGDTCFAAILMPNGATSTLTGQTQNTGHKWFTFTPTTPEIKITITNTNLGSNHVHDIMLFEGVCLLYNGVGHDSAWKDTTLTLRLHEALVGTPYFIETFNQRSDCPLCSSPANFNIEVQSLPAPVRTVSNGVVYLNGSPSHMDQQVLIRINKRHLNVSNVNNTSLVSGTASQFFDALVVGSIADQLFNSDTASAGALVTNKVYPKMTFADTIGLSRDSQLVKVSPLFETFVLTISDNTSIFSTSRLLSVASGVTYAEPNLVLTQSSGPNDAYYSGGLDNLHNGTGTFPDANISVEPAWNLETGHDFINIGVYDSGIDQTHVEFSGKTITGFNYVNNANIVAGGCSDGYGHGTACAGIIAANRNNSIGIPGIAGGDNANGQAGCSLIDMRILNSQGGGLSLANVQLYVNAIQDGAKSISDGGYGLHIMNNSLGYVGAYSQTLHDAVRDAVQRGVIFVASRGNYWGSTTTCSNGPSNYNVTDESYPACYADAMVINVGASGSDGQSKSPLNGDISDPCDNDLISMSGENVDVIAPGTSAVVTKTTASSCAGNPSSAYIAFGGTSSAAAHVSGVAGLILSQANSAATGVDNLSIEDVEWLLQQSANNKSFTSGQHYDSNNGWGLINAGSAVGDINNGIYKIQHFALNDSKGTTGNANDNNHQPFSVNQPITLTEPYGDGILNAGTYMADLYKWNIELRYTLSDPSDVVVTAWPRLSASSGWSSNYRPLSIDTWVQLVNYNSTEANLVTWQYDIKTGQTGPVDPLYPAKVYAGISVYTYNSNYSGINKVTSDAYAFGVYPNPAQNTTMISVKVIKSEQVSLEIYDMLGALVKTITKEKLQEGNHEFNVSISDMAVGVYQVKLSTETTYSTKKLIVVR
jgi:subtilisin family serine protease